jgi:serpin B
MQSSRQIVFPLLLLAVAAACNASAGPDRGTRPEPLTALPRALTAPEQRVVAGSNAFAFGLLREVAQDDAAGNLFLSPLSASLALGMTMNGARGETLDGMRSALGFGGAALTEVNPAYHDLMALLLGLDPGVDLRLANSIWARQGFPILQSFSDDVSRYFNAEANVLDFNDAGAAGRINDWVKRGTGGMITTIVDPPIPADVVLYLINATYFKGSWSDRFDPAETHDAPFHAADGSLPSVRMMHRAGSARYFEAADARGVELPYGRDAFVMDVVLPATGRTVGDVVASLDTARWNGWLAGLRTGAVDVSMPSYRLENDRVLNPQLIRLGMQAAFTPNGADFTGLSPAGKQLFISKVRQKTYADVNEEGTEAAAVTSVGVSLTAMPVLPTFVFDHPFLVAIRERFSGTILFLGAVRAP